MNFSSEGVSVDETQIKFLLPDLNSVEQKKVQ